MLCSPHPRWALPAHARPACPPLARSPGHVAALCAAPLPQPEEVRSLVKVGQEAFLTQLLDVGFFHGGEAVHGGTDRAVHVPGAGRRPARAAAAARGSRCHAARPSMLLPSLRPCPAAPLSAFPASPHCCLAPPPVPCPRPSLHADPHPGNLLKVTEGPHAGKLALLDFGLVAEIPQVGRGGTGGTAGAAWRRMTPPPCQPGPGRAMPAPCHRLCHRLSRSLGACSHTHRPALPCPALPLHTHTHTHARAYTRHTLPPADACPAPLTCSPTARPWCLPPSTWPTAIGPPSSTTLWRSASCRQTATGVRPFWAGGGGRQAGGASCLRGRAGVWPEPVCVCVCVCVLRAIPCVPAPPQETPARPDPRLGPTLQQSILTPPRPSHTTPHHPTQSDVAPALRPPPASRPGDPGDGSHPGPLPARRRRQGLQVKLPSPVHRPAGEAEVGEGGLLVCVGVGGRAGCRVWPLQVWPLRVVRWRWVVGWWRVVGGVGRRLRGWGVEGAVQQ